MVISDLHTLECFSGQSNAVSRVSYSSWSGNQTGLIFLCLRDQILQKEILIILYVVSKHFFTTESPKLILQIVFIA